MLRRITSTDNEGETNRTSESTSGKRIFISLSGRNSGIDMASIEEYLFTDGAKYVADTAGAYRLLDEIALIQSFDNNLQAKYSRSGHFWLTQINPLF